MTPKQIAIRINWSTIAWLLFRVIIRKNTALYGDVLEADKAVVGCSSPCWVLLIYVSLIL